MLHCYFFKSNFKYSKEFNVENLKELLFYKTIITTGFISMQTDSILSLFKLHADFTFGRWLLLHCSYFTPGSVASSSVLEHIKQLDLWAFALDVSTPWNDLPDICMACSSRSFTSVLKCHLLWEACLSTPLKRSPPITLPCLTLFDLSSEHWYRFTFFFPVCLLTIMFCSLPTPQYLEKGLVE